MSKNASKSKRFGASQIAMGGLFSALSFVFLYLAGIVPGLELTFYALASAMPALMIIEYAVSAKSSNAVPGVIVYVVTVVLGFIIMPNKLAILPFALFFGIYGVIKYYIEKFNSVVMRVGLKLLIFGGFFSVAYLGFRGLLFANIRLPKWGFPVLLVAAVLFLLLYDYLFSLGMTYYINRLHRENFRPLDRKGNVVEPGTESEAMADSNAEAVAEEVLKAELMKAAKVKDVSPKKTAAGKPEVSDSEALDAMFEKVDRSIGD